MNHRGVILIEAIMAVVMMTIGVTILTQSLLSSYRSIYLQKSYTQALFLVESHLSKILSDGQDFPESPSDRESLKFQYKEELKESGPSLKTADLTVQWPSGPKERQISVTTFVYDASQKQL
ncbi:MAG: hypothetical protein HQL15_06630 [Candidatus Omnitrophica bacterium]|nr:hypothetical protein [Candidatus Omnitrophota bacterium]